MEKVNAVKLLLVLNFIFYAIEANTNQIEYVEPIFLEEESKATTKEEEDPWWLKDIPWFLPPPPEWGPIPPTMFMSYWQRPVAPPLSTPNYYPLYTKDNEYFAAHAVGKDIRVSSKSDDTSTSKPNREYDERIVFLDAVSHVHHKPSSRFRRMKILNRKQRDLEMRKSENEGLMLPIRNIPNSPYFRSFYSASRSSIAMDPPFLVSTTFKSSSLPRFKHSNTLSASSSSSSSASSSSSSSSSSSAPLFKQSKIPSSSSMKLYQLHQLHQPHQSHQSHQPH